MVARTTSSLLIVLRPLARALARELAIGAGLGAVVALVEVAFVEHVASAPPLSQLLRFDRAAWLLGILLIARALVTALVGARQSAAQERLAATLRTTSLRAVWAASPYARLPLGRDALADELSSDAGAAVALPFAVVDLAVGQSIRVVGLLWTLSAAALPLFALLALFALATALVSRVLDRRVMAALDAQHARSLDAALTVRDGVAHQATWMTSGAVERLAARIGTQFDAALRASVRAARWHSLLQLALRVVQYAVIAAGTWLATRLAHQTPGPAALASFALAVAWLRAPLAAAANVRAMATQASPAIARLAELRALPPLVPSSAATRALPTQPVLVTLEEVSFRYPGGAVALDGLTLSWSAGTMLGVTGPSGAGKSTLLRLLARLALPDAGAIRVDGVPLADFDEAMLRRLVGVALQPPELVRGTLRDNLLLAGADASGLPDVVDALALGGLDLDQLLEATPLSSGQLVRVGLARLLLTRPSLALIDEPTASLDADAAERVLAALTTFARGRTVCVVSHDPRVLARCDRVVHLRDGREDRSAAPMALASASVPSAERARRRSGRGE
jgi:ABC-type multidrug transport system fused ATPase/permease subunit